MRNQLTLRFEIFWRETANWQEGHRQVWLGNIHNFAESSESYLVFLKYMTG